MTTKSIHADAVIDAAKIRPVHIVVGLLGALVLLVDGYFLQAIGFVAPKMAEEWHISKPELGPVFTATLIGQLLGYTLIAPLSHRFGQKRVVIGSVVVFGLLEILATAATNTMEMIGLLFITGIALGGVVPNIVALTGELFPLRRRATAITLIFIGMAVGQMAVGEVAKFVVDEHGWRPVLWVGGVASLLTAAALAAFMPESVEYLVNRTKRKDEAVKTLKRMEPGFETPQTLTAGFTAEPGKKVSPWQLFNDGRGMGTLLIWLGKFFILMVSGVWHSWLTTMLVDNGIPLKDAIFAGQVASAAGIVAAFIIGPLVDRFGPYRVTWILFLLGSAAISLLGLSISFLTGGLILATAFATGFATSSLMKSTTVLCVYFYPTTLRATGIGTALAIGRIGNIVGPIAVGFLIGWGWQASGVFLWLAVPMLLGAIGLYIMGRQYDKKRRKKPEIETTEPELAALKS